MGGGNFCVGCLILAFVVATGFIVLIVFMVGEAIYRNPPSFDVLDFRLSGLDETLTSRSTELMTNSTLAIVAKNRGKSMNIHYGDFRVSVRTQRGQIELGKGILPGFHQRSKERTIISGNVTSSNARLDAGQRDLLVQGRDQRKLQLVIIAKSRTHYKGKFDPAGTKVIAEVHCKLDIDPQITNGTTQHFWQSCDLKHFGCYGSADYCGS